MRHTRPSSRPATRSIGPLGPSTASTSAPPIGPSQATPVAPSVGGRWRRTLAVVATVVATVGSGLVAVPASAAVVTPGSFTGYGFDQCLTPSQRAMDAWLTSSPFLAVGIYVSGDSRFCRRQPNLTPTWVATQLRKGWRLLPITLGPQASCTTRERYRRQVRISPSPTGSYAAARRQGRAEATEAVGAARRLGISPRSTLWYDLEAFSTTPRHCRESALSFLSAWTVQLHRLGYVSGVYSSAGSGISMLDDARVKRPGRYRMPDQVWIADWNNRASVASSYVRASGWMPHRRVHQYRGGHDETHGGVTINIDSNWLDLGRGSRAAPEREHCGGAASFNHGRYATRTTGDSGTLVRTVQCLLRGRGGYADAVDGRYDRRLGDAVRRYRVGRGLPAGTATTRATWVALLSHGSTPLLKTGSAGESVRRVQRALNAADGAGLKVSGVYGTDTTAAVRRYQRSHRRAGTGVVTAPVWRLLQAGRS